MGLRTEISRIHWGRVSIALGLVFLGTALMQVTSPIREPGGFRSDRVILGTGSCEVAVYRDAMPLLEQMGLREMIEKCEASDGQG